MATTTRELHRPCHTCRLRHVACDRMRPCGRCARLGDTCIDPPPRGPRRVHPGRGKPSARSSLGSYPAPTAALEPRQPPSASSASSCRDEAGGLQHQHQYDEEEEDCGSEESVMTVMRDGPSSQIETLLLVELKRLRRQVEGMAGKVHRMAKRQRTMQGQMDTLMPQNSVGSSSSSPSSFTSSSSSSSPWSSASPPSPPQPQPLHLPRRFSPSDWLDANMQQPSPQTLVLSTHPSSNLLSSLDNRPWLIERVVQRSELHLAKHRCPPGLEELLWSVPVTLITGFNDQLCRLFKYTQEEMEEMNGLRLYTPSSCEMIASSAEEVFKQSPVSSGPVFVVSAPMVDKHGGVLHTVGRWQAFYDSHGDFSWGVTVLDRWTPAPPSDEPSHQQAALSCVPQSHHQHHHQQQHYQTPAPVPLPAQPPSVRHPSPPAFCCQQYPALDDLLYSQLLGDDDGQLPPP